MPPPLLLSVPLTVYPSSFHPLRVLSFLSLSSSCARLLFIERFRPWRPRLSGQNYCYAPPPSHLPPPAPLLLSLPLLPSPASHLSTPRAKSLYSTLTTYTLQFEEKLHMSEPPSINGCLKMLQALSPPIGFLQFRAHAPYRRKKQPSSLFAKTPRFFLLILIYSTDL